MIQIADLAYYICFARNLSIYEDNNLLEAEIIRRGETIIRDHHLAMHQHDPPGHPQATPTGTSRTTNLKHWTRLTNGWVKVNCDANLQQIGRAHV